MLYVFSIQQKASDPEDRHLSVATRCQEQMSMIAEEHSLARRYCLVLDELRKEAIRHSEQPPDDQTMVAADDDHLQHLEKPDPEEAVLAETAGFGQHPLASDVNDINGFDASPGSSLYDMSGWGTFDSMVSKQVLTEIIAKTLLIRPRSHLDSVISRICWVTVLSSSPTRRKEYSNQIITNVLVILYFWFESITTTRSR